MEYQHRQTGKRIKMVANNLVESKNILDNINMDCCSGKTQQIIDEVYDCIDIAIRYIKQIDIQEYDAGYNGEHII